MCHEKVIATNHAICITPALLEVLSKEGSPQMKTSMISN